MTSVVGGRRAGAHAVRRHRERAAHVRLRRRREHHGEPRVARADAQAPHLPAERLSLARSRGGNGRVLSGCAATSTSRARARRAAAQALERSSSASRSTRRRASRCGSSSRASSPRCAGEAPIAVTGEDGREALAVALHDRARHRAIAAGALRSARRRARVREILFVAGEASGDLHAAGVARALMRARRAVRARRASAATRCATAGVELIEHIGAARRDGLRRGAEARAAALRAAAASSSGAFASGQRRARRADRLLRTST